MYCTKCGNKIKEGNKFCTKCGVSLNKDEIRKSDTKEKADGKAVASLVIGLISLLLSFSLSIIVFPLELIGLIIGILSKTKCSEKTGGIVINIISMIVSFISFVIIIVLIIIIGVFSDRAKDVELDNVDGDVNYTWNCKVLEESEYAITFSINTYYGSYVWSKYDDTINNAVYGNYELNKIDEDKYTIKLTSTSIIQGGMIDDHEHISNYEIVFDNGDNFLMTSLDNMSKYYCDFEG